MMLGLMIAAYSVIAAFPNAAAPPGRSALAFRNTGKVRHELSVELLKAGVTVDSILKVGKAGGDADGLMEGSFGLLTARASSTPLGRLELDLLPGREYLIACFFRDSANAPEHVDLGMYGAIRVAGRTPRTTRGARFR